MTTIPRFRWKDLRNGQTFEIIIDKFENMKTTYYGQFCVLNALFDVGVSAPDLRKCELSLPLRAFNRALLEYPRGWRQNLKDKQMKIKILKLAYGHMKILEMKEA